MKPLSKSEEQLLHILWDKEPAYMKDVLAGYSDPVPAKTTVATLFKRMIDKGYVEYESDGGLRRYSAKVTKVSYLRKKISGLISNFFDDSPTQFASFFAEEMDMSPQEVEEIKEMYLSNKKDRK